MTVTGSRASGGMNESEQWRAEVSTRLQESANAHRETAVILERIKGQLDGHAIRITALESEPNRSRATIGTATQIVGVAIGGLGCLGSLAALIGASIMAVAGPIIVYFLLH